MSTTVPNTNTTQLERGTAHPVGSTGHNLFNKDSHHNNTTNTMNSNQTSTFSKEGMHANTGAGDTYGHSDTIVKTGQYATGLENNTTSVPLRGTAHLPSAVSDKNQMATGHAGLTGHHAVGTGVAGTGVGAAHLPAGSAVPVVGGQQNVITGVNNVPTAGAQMQNTLPNAANRDGLVVNDGIGGPLGGAVILGGQCECLANGGACSHGAGQCVCRGCTSQATTVNPGINIGVSTAQYTAPAGSSGFGGGVNDRGTGIAGLVQPNPASQMAGHHTTGTGHHGTTAATTGTTHHGGLSGLFHHNKDNTTHTTGTDHHATTGHGLTGSHHTGTTTAATTGTGLTGATGMHHAARNVDGDGHHALGGSNIGTSNIGTTNAAGTNTMGTNTYTAPRI